MVQASRFRRFTTSALGAVGAVGIILAVFVIPISAFEARVVNVTAVIENPEGPEEPQRCDVLGWKYWEFHEGCVAGTGESDWTPEINDLSGTFSGVFAAYTGSDICRNTWLINCSGGDVRTNLRCRAKLHILIDELNVVSAHLDLEAILSDADNGSPSFDHLGLTPNSTIRETIAAIEETIVDPDASFTLLLDAAQVARRIYLFYEFLNPERPACVYAP